MSPLVKHFSLSLALSIALAAASKLTCKCDPSSDCWPSQDQWSEFNRTIDGRLIKGEPPAIVCYPDEPAYNASACHDVIAQWTSSAFHAADPVSVDSPPVDSGCYPIYPNGTDLLGNPMAGAKGCDVETYPAYVVNATEDTHVQSAVKFVRKHNLRLNVKNTGHGRSVTPGSLSVWTHHFKDIEYVEDFVIHGSNATNSTKPRMAFTFGAGIQDREAFEAAAKHNAVVVGGTDSTVGLLGWLSGGGHGYLTAAYGMGADNVLEATVVTPQGDIMLANEHQNADLFWAIRGGGGGTFGVLTKLTVKAYPMPSMKLWSLSVSPKNGTSDAKWWNTVAHVLSRFPAVKSAGLSGYITMSGPPLSFTYAMFGYNMSNSTIEAAIAPTNSYLDTQDDTVTVSSQVQSFSKWIDFYHLFNLTESAGGGGSAATSRLLPARALTADVDFLAKVLQKVGPSSEESVGNISGPSISGTCVASAVHEENALNPAWRDTMIHFRVSKSWDGSTPEDEAANATRAMTDKTGYALRQLAPDAGAYINEADKNEPNWQWSLFGEHYARLLATKHKYDPEAIQWCSHCVGSEEWVAIDGRLCKQSWA